MDPDSGRSSTYNCLQYKKEGDEQEWVRLINRDLIQMEDSWRVHTTVCFPTFVGARMLSDTPKVVQIVTPHRDIETEKRSQCHISALVMFSTMHPGVWYLKPLSLAVKRLK